MASRPESYGPNHEAVSRFIVELPEYPWFTAWEGAWPQGKLILW